MAHTAERNLRPLLYAIRDHTLKVGKLSAHHVRLVTFVSKAQFSKFHAVKGLTVRQAQVFAQHVKRGTIAPCDQRPQLSALLATSVRKVNLSAPNVLQALIVQRAPRHRLPVAKELIVLSDRLPARPALKDSIVSSIRSRLASV